MATADPTPAPPRWLVEAPAPGAGTGSGRPRRGVVAAVLGLAVGVGVALGVASWLRIAPYPAVLPLFVGQAPGDPAPSVAFAAQDVAALGRGGFFSGVLGPGFVLLEPRSVDGAIEAAGQARPGQDLVVYLSARARVDGERGVVVLTRGDEPDGARGGVPLDRIFRTIDASPARQTLLILDIMRPAADPIGGFLPGDVASRVAGILNSSAARPGRLLVLCACGPGQVSRDSVAWGRSVFNAYVEEALRGWADVEPGSGNRDGRVSAKELAAYVEGRVGRWARVNCGADQTPVLLGDGRDFPVAPHGLGRLGPALEPPEARAYPEWLVQGWARRDRFAAKGASRFAPRAFRLFEASLLRAESAWRSGGDAAALRDRWLAEADRLAPMVDRAGVIPHPAPRSLALAISLGVRPDEATAMSLSELLATRDMVPAGSKPEEIEAAKAKKLADFAARVKDKPDVALALAVFEAAAALERPTPQDILFLDGLLRARQPDPISIETRFLRRLADMTSPARADGATPTAAWSSSTIRLALDVVRRGERAQARPWSFARVRPWLDEAARERQMGEIALGSPGFVPPGEAEGHLKRSADLYTAILSTEDAVEGALRLRGESLATLGDILPYLEFDPTLDAAWEGLVRELDGLEVELRKPPGPAPESERPEAAGLAIAVDPLRFRAESLGKRLAALRAPFAPDRLARLVAVAPSAEDDARNAGQIEAILGTPFAPSADRKKLWEAGQVYARRLLEATESATIGGSMSAEGRDLPARDDALRRSGWLITLLRLAGLPAPELEALKQEQSRAGGPSPALEPQIRKAWEVRLPALDATLGEADRERLGRIVPESIASRALDPSEEPARSRAVREWAGLWSWLAGVYACQALDTGGSTFFAEAAFEYGQFGGAPRTPGLRLALDPPALEVGPSRAVAVATVRLIPLGSTLEPPTPARLQLVNPDEDWLSISLESGRAIRPGAADPTPGQGGDPIGSAVAIRVERRSNGERSGRPRPSGFLIRARSGDWTYSLVVPVAIRSASDEFPILLGPGDAGPTALPSELRVRPTGQRQPFSLFVKNPTGTPREVVVELKAGDDGPSVVSAKVSISPDGMVPVVFGTPAVKPGEELPELRGPLQIRVLGEGRPDRVLASRSVEVDIQSPLEYVRISDVRYQPPRPDLGEKDRLTVSLEAAGSLKAPECPVRLNLSPDRIPGLLSAEAGALAGMLAPGGRLTLFAEELRLDETSDAAGRFSIDVDAVPRALTFRGRLAREGVATFPRLDDAVGLRLKAPRAARSGAAVPVVVEVDNAGADSRLELALGRRREGIFDPLSIRQFPSPRRRHLGFAPGGEGGRMQLEASIGDWSASFDTAGLKGRYELIARLRDTGGIEVLAAIQGITLDDGPPRWAKFVDLPAKARKGTILRASAIGDEPESGIAQVRFFVGRPPAEGPLPPSVVAVEARRDPRTSKWKADLPLPSDKAGPVDLGVQFTSGAGLIRYATAPVELTETDPIPLGSIDVRVAEGPLPQPGLVVVLSDAKNEKRGEGKTDRDGRFMFKDIPAGLYLITVVRPDSGTSGRKQVEVKAGEDVEVEVELFRRPG